MMMQEPSVKPSRRHVDWLLVGIAVLTAFLNLYAIWNDKTGNTYYTTAVASMLQSWHNFFYASFDPGGYVTVDKPPLTFMIQTAFAYVFGLHPWSVILPQALAGVGSVLLLYALVKPTYGKTAAWLASLVAACTPIAAAVSRTNNVDSLLVFTLLVAAWMLFKSIRSGKWGWAVGSFAVVGLAFNMKMLQAYMVLPAFYLLMLLAYRANWKQKLGVFAASTAALLVVSLSWAVIVDSTPADQRPYIGSSQTNSVLELAFGYNGISRLTGDKGMGGRGGAPGADDGGAGRAPGGDGQGAAPNSSGQVRGGGRAGEQGQQSQQGAASGGANREAQGDGVQGTAPDGAGRVPGDGNLGGGQLDFPGGGGPSGGGMFNTGQAGPLRMFQSALASQISWVLPFALLAAIGLLAGLRWKRRLTVKQTEALFWLAWLLPGMAFFSVAGFFHTYYLIMLMPPIAALAGSGGVELWNTYRHRDSWRAWLLPVSILVTTAFQLYLLKLYKSQIGLVWPIAVTAGGTAFAVLLILRVLKKESFTRLTALGALFVLLAAPLYWAATPLLYGGNSMIPEAGPQLQRGSGQPGRGMAMGMNGTASIDSKLYDYLKEHNSGEKFLFATTNYTTAAPYIIQTGDAVMAMGGFSGNDPILTVEKLEKLVENKEVKYFLLPSTSGLGGQGGFGGRGGSSEVQTWIRENGTEIPKEDWASSTSDAAAIAVSYTPDGTKRAADRPDAAGNRANNPGIGMPFGDRGMDSMVLYQVNP